MLRRIVKILPSSFSYSTSKAYDVSHLSVKDLEVQAQNLDVQKALHIYKEHGCVVVRGLNREYVQEIKEHGLAAAREAVELLPQARKIPEGWVTPEGTLFIPTPAQLHKQLGRDRQIMVLGLDYLNSGAMLRAALDQTCLDLVSAILGPDVEIFGKGQMFYKEPLGLGPKLLHQDGAYFEFAKQGPVGTLNYAVDTNLTLNNGPLFVVPGTHKQKQGVQYAGLTEKSSYMPHIDTASHLALDQTQWQFDRALPIEGEAGDTIFFHINLVHGSPPNYSKQPRPTFINRYIAADDYAIIPVATSVELRQKAREKYKANPESFQQFKERQYLVRGRRKYDGKQWNINIAHH